MRLAKVRMHDSRPTPSPSHAALQRELQDVSGKVQLKRGVAPEEHRKMKMQHAAAMRDVMLASGARKVRMHDSKPTPSPSHAALQRELQGVSGKVQLKRGVAPEEHRKMKMQHAAAMRDVMLASGARKVRMHDSRPTSSPSHAALQRELQDVSGKVQLKRGVAPEEHRKMKMQHAAAMRDVMLASGAARCGCMTAGQRRALPMQRCNGNYRMSREKCN